MRRHDLWMIIGCTVPLLLIFLLPLFGVRGNFGIFVFIILMFACHLLMHGQHGKHKKHDDTGGEHGSH